MFTENRDAITRFPIERVLRARALLATSRNALYVYFSGRTSLNALVSEIVCSFRARSTTTANLRTRDSGPAKDDRGSALMRAFYILLLCGCAHEETHATVTVAPLPSVSATASASPTATATPTASASPTTTATATAFDPMLNGRDGPEPVQRTIASLRPLLRQCYNRGLKIDPNLTGAINLVIKLAPDGSVASVAKNGGTGLTIDVETCIQDRIRSARFAPQGPQGSSLALPLRFQGSTP